MQPEDSKATQWPITNQERQQQLATITTQQPAAHAPKCYGLTSARLCWIAIGWHGVGCRLWDTGQGLEMDCV